MSASERVSLRERFTRIEFVVVIVIVAISLLIFSTAIPKAWALHERLTCQENLKVIGEALRMYASESKGEVYPMPKLRDCAGNVQPWSGALDLNGFHPEYLADLDSLVCPAYPAGATALEVWDEGKTTNPRWTTVEGFSNNGEVDPCEVLAKPYYYYGWALSDATFESVTRYERPEPEDGISKEAKERGLAVEVHFHSTIHFNRFKMAVFSPAKRQEVGEVDGTPWVWAMQYPNGKPLQLPMGSEIPSLREGAERFYIRDIGNPAGSAAAQARVVVLHEELLASPSEFYHGNGRLNVLFMDGHVEFRAEPQDRWRAAFPLNEAGLILHDAVEGTLALP